MKLGIVADEIDRDFAAAVRTGLSLGIRRYEVRHLKTGRFPAAAPEDLRETERVIANEDIEITGISPGLFKLTDTQKVFDREMNEIYPKAAEWANRWEVQGLIVFGFHKPGATEDAHGSYPDGPPPQAIEWLQQAAERANSDGLLLMIEPEPICWADTSTATADLIRRVNSPALRMNYDPGNVAWLQQNDPLNEFAAASPHISNVHIKDLHRTAPGAKRPQFVPAGEGIIDWRRHFDALTTSGYNGPFTLEPHMDGNPETIRRCKEAVERYFSQ